MEQFLKDLDIDEFFTKLPRKPKAYTHVRDNIPREASLNYMADLLMLPKTKAGYKYLLVMTDLSTNEFDVQEMKAKTAEATLQAMKDIFKRGILKKPHFSIHTDNGGEFMGTFQEFLKKNNIYHGKALPDRHTQQSVVERLNRDLGRILNGYMNSIEEETEKPYYEWTDILDVVREKLNKIRKVPPKITATVDYKFPNVTKGPKYEVGELVYRLLDAPTNALGHPQPTKQFRVGDYVWEKNPRKIEAVYYYSDPVPYRYKLAGIKNASFTERQLKPSQETVEKFVVSKIVDKRKRKGKWEYLIRWKGMKKNDDTWETEESLLEDGLHDYIDDFNGSSRKR